MEEWEYDAISKKGLEEKGVVSESSVEELRKKKFVAGIEHSTMSIYDAVCSRVSDVADGKHLEVIAEWPVVPSR